jgi:hypothetical protein
MLESVGPGSCLDQALLALPEYFDRYGAYRMGDVRVVVILLRNAILLICENFKSDVWCGAFCLLREYWNLQIGKI